MVDENPTLSKAIAITESMTALIKEVPIYRDAIQPGAQEVGKAVATVGKAINVALAPLKLLVWGYDRIEEYLQHSLQSKLNDVPPEEIVTPKPNIAGPAIEALRFAGQDTPLREMYAQLLATAMRRATADRAHPSFVEMIKQLSPLEAHMLKRIGVEELVPTLHLQRRVIKPEHGFRSVLRHFTVVGLPPGMHDAETVSASIDNLSRLGLMDVPAEGEVVPMSRYDPLLNHPVVAHLRSTIESEDVKLHIHKGYIAITSLGRMFCAACIP